MPSLDAGALAETTVRLGLLDAHQVQDAWDELGSRSVPGEDFLRVLERKRYLTPFQTSKIVKGDKDGYFMGGYRILYKVASGSFGRVYRADDPSTGRIVAIKVLRKKWSEDKHKIDLFMREGKMGQSLVHPNIVEILAVSQDKKTGQYFLVMEFVEGGNLRDFLNIRKKLTPAEVLRILEDVASGLTAAFAKGITHRDMKLTNVLLSSAGPAKLVDFGLAGAQFGPSDDKDDVSVDRTVDYAGLERATDAPHGDPRSDLFFVGCVAYELLTGRSPLEKPRSAEARMASYRFQKIPPMTPEEVQAPASVFRLVDNLLALDPAQRIQTAAQLLERVRVCRAELDGKKSADDAKKPQATIFLVETDEKLQDILRTKLKEKGFRILIAADPVRALDRFRQQPFDLLIVDASTTGDNGYYVFERIMDDAQRQSIACAGILMIKDDQMEWQKKVAEFPNTVTLVQPIKYKQLVGAIQTLLPGAGAKAGAAV
jgi:eukaryotic-like serine/threonine-protein kinase